MFRSKMIMYLFGYLRRPYLWFDLLRQPWRLICLRLKRERSRKTAEQWASKRSISTQDFITSLSSNDKPNTRIEERHAEILHKAEQAANNIPADLGGPANFPLLYAVVRSTKPEYLIETGVAAGWSSLAILLAMADNNKGKLISIDRPDMKLKDDRYIGSVVPQELRGRWELLLGTDRDRLPLALKSLGQAQIDLIHYDSDKSYYGRKWAYNLLWNHLSPGGHFISHDIGDNTAFRDFASQVNHEPIVVSFEKQFVGILKKDLGV